MMKIVHLTAGARERTRLVHTDIDRFELLRRLAGSFERALLAFCLLDTHLHLVAEGESAAMVELLCAVLRAYGAGFLRRHGLAGPFLRGRPLVAPVENEAALARTIHYVHDNPVKAKMTEKQLEFANSSAREYVGLSLARRVNLERARFLLGAELESVVRKTPELVELDALATTSPGLDVLAAATAEALGVPVHHLLGMSRSADARRGRALFVALARVEFHAAVELAAFLGVGRTQVWKIGRAEVAEHDVRVARTLARVAGFRRRLHLPAASELAHVGR